MTTTTPTLTDRYVAAVLRALPEAKRADIERELRASIADAVDAKVAAGATPETAEREVLAGLGEPERLAAGYAGRPLHLIGPAYFVEYSRLLRLLLVIVVPIVAVVFAALGIATQAPVGEIVWTPIWTAFTVGVHLCFWITLVFVILERTGASTLRLPFDLDELPALPSRSGITISDFVASLVFGIFVIAALIWQQFSSPFTDAAGHPIPLLDPALWSFWIPFFLAAGVLTIVHAIALHRTRRWTWPLAATAVVLNLAVGIPVVVLQLRGELLNPAYFAAFEWERLVAPGGVGTTIIVFVVVVTVTASIADAVVKTVRAGRA